MSRLQGAHTEPVNPPGAQPVLSRDQVWAGLQVKVRDPAKFVPVVAGFGLVSDEGDVVTREIEFKPGAGPPGKLVEVCTSSPAENRVVFEMASGDQRYNVINPGAGGPEDLTLTFGYDLRPVASVEEEQRNDQIIKNALGETIKTIRKLAIAGEI